MAKATGVEVARISVRVSPDTKDFRRELKKDLEEIERSVRATVGVEAKLDTAGAKAHLRAALAEMKAQAASSNIEAKLGLDTNFLRNSIKGMAAQLATVGENAQSAGEGFASLGRTGWIVGAVFAAAAPVIGLVAGLLAGLPSLLASVAIPVGSIALGLDGIKKAAQSIAPQFDALKASVSSVFEQGLGPVFQQLTSLMPILTSGFSGVAQQLVGVAQGVTNVLTSSGGMAQMATIFGNVGDFIGALTPTLQSFTSTMLTLGADGAKNLGLLLQPLQQFATQFDQMIGRVSQSGVLQGAFQGLSQTLGSLLTLFNQLFESGLQAMSQLGGPLSNMISGIGNAFVAFMPALTSFSALAGNVFGELGNQLGPILTSLTPGLSMLADTLGTTLTGALKSLGPTLVPLATSLSNGVVAALQQLQPILPGVIQSFVQLGTAIGGQLTSYLPQLATAFGQIAGVLAENAPLMLQMLASTLTSMVPVLVKAAPGMMQLAQGLADLMVSVGPAVPMMVQVAGAVIQVGTALAGGVVGAIQGFASAFQQAVSAVSSFVGAVVSGVGQVISEITSLPGKITSAVSNFGSLLVQAGKDLIQGLINGIKSMASAAISAATDIASSVAGAVKGFLGIHSPSVVFDQIGQNIGQGLVNGLDGQQSNVASAAKDLASTVKDHFDKGVKLGGGLKFGADGFTTDSKDPWKKAEASLFNAPIDFTKATGQQFLSDIGVSGDGVISKAVTEGINYVFNIGSVDEALSIKDREESKKAIAVVGRT